MDENIFVFVENIKILSNWIDGWKNECGWNVVNKQMNTVVMMIDFENNGWNSSVHVNLLQYFRYFFCRYDDYYDDDDKIFTTSLYNGHRHLKGNCWKK